jgi:hypothetical protein
MAARCLSARRLPGRQLRPPSGRYRSPTPLLCYPFLHRVRWREVSSRPGRRSILHSAFRALRNRPKSGLLCRCCKRSSHSNGWVAANGSFGVAAGGASPKRNICYNYDNRWRGGSQGPRRCEGPPAGCLASAAFGMRGTGRRRALSSRPPERRSMPITTTALPFTVRLEPGGTTRLR